MSRAYSMYVVIEEYRPERCQQVQKAAESQWSFDDWDVNEQQMSAMGESSLAGGESEVEFADRLAKAVWRANGEYCPLTVDATYLDSLPCESYLRDEADFERLMNVSPDFRFPAVEEEPLPALAPESTSPAEDEPIAVTEWPPIESHDYELLLDGDVLHEQRELLHRLHVAFWNRQAFAAEPHDEALLEGLLRLTDTLADQAHDRHGIDCLLVDYDAGDANDKTPTEKLVPPNFAEVQQELADIGADN